MEEASRCSRAVCMYAETRESGQSVEVLAVSESSAVSAWDVFDVFHAR
jgi:hypothetical protein